MTPVRRRCPARDPPGVPTERLARRLHLAPRRETVLTLRDIDHALDDLGLESFMPHTTRVQALRGRRERSRHANVLGALSGIIRGWREGRLARRDVREVPAGVTVIVSARLNRRITSRTKAGRR